MDIYRLRCLQVLLILGRVCLILLEQDKGSKFSHERLHVLLLTALIRVSKYLVKRTAIRTKAVEGSKSRIFYLVQIFCQSHMSARI